MRSPFVPGLIMIGVLVAACDRMGEVPAATSTAPPAATPMSLCSDVGGDWDGPQETCRVTGTSDQGATMKISAKYPQVLLGDPTAGLVISAYVREFVDQFRHPMVVGWEGHEGSATTSYRQLEHLPAITSVVFTEDWFVPGTAHPGAALRTFTFDRVQRKQLQLADLFCEGIDPLKALPPIARSYVEKELAERGGNYAQYFPAEQFEPGAKGSLADDYQAWALDGDALVLYMPSGRGPGGLPPGSVTARVPLTALRGILRDGGCSV